MGYFVKMYGAPVGMLALVIALCVWVVGRVWTGNQYLECVALLSSDASATEVCEQLVYPEAVIEREAAQAKWRAKAAGIGVK